MAHTKAGGSTRLGRDSAGQRLGVKLFGGQIAKSGAVIVRQRGSKILPGPGAALGHDYTVYATRAGVVTFQQKRASRFTGRSQPKTVVSVEPIELANNP